MAGRAGDRTTVGGCVVIAPQLALYYQATGRFLVSSYGSLGLQLHVAASLGRAVQRSEGTVLLVAAAAGGACGIRLRSAARTERAFLAGTAVVLVANTYLIASWWDWQFGGSYGHRGFVDGFPIFAIGLAGVLPVGSGVSNSAVVVTICATVAIALSVVQMLQYWNRVMPMSRHDVGSLSRRLPAPAVMRRSHAVGAVAIAVLVAILFWLRDPAWLATVDGFRTWQTEADSEVPMDRRAMRRFSSHPRPRRSDPDTDGRRAGKAGRSSSRSAIDDRQRRPGVADR